MYVASRRNSPVKYLLSSTEVFCRLLPLSHVKSAKANGTFAVSARAFDLARGAVTESLATDRAPAVLVSPEARSESSDCAARPVEHTTVARPAAIAGRI